MDLKNITMSDIKAKFTGAADKKTLIKFGIGFGAIILFLIIYDEKITKNNKFK